jgi:hypothetical protein
MPHLGMPSTVRSAELASSLQYLAYLVSLLYRVIHDAQGIVQEFDDLGHQACQLITDLGTSLVIVDEVHGIDRSRASHAQQSDQLKYFMDHVPATFVKFSETDRCGSVSGTCRFAGRV